MAGFFYFEGEINSSKDSSVKKTMREHPVPQTTHSFIRSFIHWSMVAWRHFNLCCVSPALRPRPLTRSLSCFPEVEGKKLNQKPQQARHFAPFLRRRRRRRLEAPRSFRLFSASRLPPERPTVSAPFSEEVPVRLPAVEVRGHRSRSLLRLIFLHKEFAE